MLSLRTAISSTNPLLRNRGIRPAVSALHSGLHARQLSTTTTVAPTIPVQTASHHSVAGPNQPQSPLAPLGVAAATQFASGSTLAPRPKIFEEFALNDRVAIVSGGNGGLGLEMALALSEAGARAVYCLDLPKEPSEDFLRTAEYVSRFDVEEGVPRRLEYRSIDVTDQQGLWALVEGIADKEQRMDVCIAAAGILKAHTDCLTYPAAQFEKVMEVNANGALYTAQAAGRQMERFGTHGSIVLIASMSGTITNRGHAWVSYNASKSAVLQMGRSMACELGTKNIRVNTISPGHICTNMTAKYLDTNPDLLAKWSEMNPMGRIGRSDEMRGVAVWLASDASSFCTGSDIIVSGGHHSW
ncbi:hypothetical protein PLICRDRAFT_54562 [Plicaturopsis crispa FD-325 SS-3]|nr:hypothetical protein PLICRDRAFT_54562 [Plicaturopsis crispa FD-325 SS-3]